MKTVELTIPATIANVGPGFDVLGVAIDGLADQFVIGLTKGCSEITSIGGVDADLVPRDPQKNLITIAAEAMAERLGTPSFFSISMKRQIPVGGGLGSSAAASLAGAMGAARLLSRQVDDVTILSVALEAESLFGGRHLDNIAAAFYGGMTVALSIDPPRVVHVTSARDWWFAIVTPKFRLATKKSRSVLPTSLLQSEWTRQMALSCGVVAAWCSGDVHMMREALYDPFAESHRAELILHFYDVKQAALRAGALGCSISGAGPSVFALCESEEVARQCVIMMGLAFGAVSSMHVGKALVRM